MPGRDGAKPEPKSLWLGVRVRRPAGSRPPLALLSAICPGARGWRYVRQAVSPRLVRASLKKKWVKGGCRLPLRVKNVYKEKLPFVLRLFSHKLEKGKPVQICNPLELYGGGNFFQAAVFFRDAVRPGPLDQPTPIAS